jgi:hypothetical protein
MGSHQQQDNPDMGEMPDLDDLLVFADLDGSDVDEAVVWLEDRAPELAGAIGKEERQT